MSPHVQKLLQAARLNLAQGQHEEAEGQTSEAIRLDSKEPGAYLLRAECHRRLKRPERALADLAVAIRLDPSQPGPYVIRAEILKRRNQFDQAIADATHALTIDPRNAAAFSIRAECRSAIGDLEAANEDVQEMLLIDPTRPVPNFQTKSSEGHERLWKQSETKRSDDNGVFSDGKPVDKTYRSRQIVSDEDAAEALGVASGYKPGTIAAPVRRHRTGGKNPKATPILVSIACLALLGGGYLLTSQSQSPVPLKNQDQPAPKTKTESAVKSITTATDRNGAPTLKTPPAQRTATQQSPNEKDRPPSTTVPYRLIEIAIDRDGSGTLSLGSEGASRLDGDGPQEAGTPVSGLDGLPNTKIIRFKDRRFEIIQDFQKIREIDDLKSPFTEIDPTQLQTNAREGVLTLKPSLQQGHRAARLTYPRQLRLPVRIRFVIANYADEGFVGITLAWPKSLFNVNLKGTSADKDAPREIDCGWLLDQSKPNEWNGVELNMSDRSPNLWTFQVPLSRLLADERVSPRIGIRTGDRSMTTLKIRRIEVMAHVVGRIGVTFAERKGKVIAAKILDGPAAKAGIRPGDEFASIDSQVVKGIATLMSQLAKLDAGDSVTLGLIREGKPITLRLVAD